MTFRKTTSAALAPLVATSCSSASDHVKSPSEKESRKLKKLEDVGIEKVGNFFWKPPTYQ
jgi:hypothetical protein